MTYPLNAPAALPAWKPVGKINHTELLIILAALAAIREPLGFPVYLKFGMFIVAAAHIASMRVHRMLIFVAPMLVVATIASVVNDTPPISMAKVQFITAAALFCSFLAIQDRERLVSGLKRYLLPIIILLSLLEITIGTDKSRDMYSFLSIIGVNFPFPISVPRLRGLSGDPNFSALMMAMLAFVFLTHKERLAGAICVAILLMMVSRGGMLSLIFAGLIYFMPTRPAKVLTTGFILVIFMSIPAIIVYIDQNISVIEKIQLVIGTSRRYLHWLHYADFGWNNFFGVGYFQGKTYYAETVGLFSVGPMQARGSGIYQEAHNFVLDVWGELGPATVIAMAVFMIYTFIFAARRGRFELAMLGLLLSGYLLLSGISDWTFWMGLGLLFSRPAPQGDGKLKKSEWAQSYDSNRGGMRSRGTDLSPASGP